MARTEQAPHALHRVTVPRPLAFSLPSEWCVIPKASGSRGSPRGQGPPRFRSCIAIRRCLLLEEKAFRAHPGPGPLPHFQSSMLLHNLSSVFSLRKKASQRALRCTHLPHRTTAITHPAANAHQATPCPPITDAHSTRPAANAHQATPCPPITDAHSTRPAASLRQTATAPPAAKQVFHNLSTEFSTFSPVFHSGFLSPWLSLRETG